MSGQGKPVFQSHYQPFGNKSLPIAPPTPIVLGAGSSAQKVLASFRSFDDFASN